MLSAPQFFAIFTILAVMIAMFGFSWVLTFDNWRTNRRWWHLTCSIGVTITLVWCVLMIRGGIR